MRSKQTIALLIERDEARDEIARWRDQVKWKQHEIERLTTERDDIAVEAGEMVREMEAYKNAEVERLEAELASATDLANTYARENGVEEANTVSDLKLVIDRLAWAAAHYRLERDKSRDTIEELRGKNAEIERVRFTRTDFVG